MTVYFVALNRFNYVIGYNFMRLVFTSGHFPRAWAIDLQASANIGLIGVINCRPTSLESVDLVGLPECY